MDALVLVKKTHDIWSEILLFGLAPIDRFHVISSLSEIQNFRPKKVCSSGIKYDIFIFVCNSTAQLASFGNQSILNYRVMEVRNTRPTQFLRRHIRVPRMHISIAFCTGLYKFLRDISTNI